ncbi:hypothetical protein [Methylococcus sp. EFPC2]|uniref:hypothetical protein n=1 Tax=Methylococcus sp. EFPC2 TaxID=2812648 RepID=UPI0019682B95|nr:hypothetical protein [Methylococcus sp. EFPC2]QSA97884.1 hypothetical protein JWZ97_03385 [Methylococcus sp. EFPC2]
MKAIFCRTAALALLGTTAYSAQAASSYSLDDLADHSGGGPELVAHGGTLSGGTYTFGANQGLSLNWSGFNPADYTLGVRFSFNSLPGGWLKVLDFAHLGRDEGLYVFGDHLQFVVQAGSDFRNGPDGAFHDDQWTYLKITRDGSTQRFTAFLDGTQQFSFIDSTGQAVFAGPLPLATFFVDDTATGGGEAGAGRVDGLVVSSVPLPASAPLLLSGLAWLRTRRRAA